MRSTVSAVSLLKPKSITFPEKCSPSQKHGMRYAEVFNIKKICVTYRRTRERFQTLGGSVDQGKFLI